jgi:predicted membrane protein
MRIAEVLFDSHNSCSQRMHIWALVTTNDVSSGIGIRDESHWQVTFRPENTYTGLYMSVCSNMA